MVSIIVPNYNHESFLTERIESILDQSYQNFEVIILDDCSTDNSKNIIEKYRDHPKVSHIVYNDQNSGSTFKQWEKGILLAKGEFIWIAESDDVAHPDFLTSLMQVFTPECNLVFCRSRIIDENGIELKLIGDGYVPAFPNDIKEIGRVFANEFMQKANNIPNASAVIFRRDYIDFSIFEKSNKTRLLGDWIFWLHLLSRNGRIYYLSRVMNDFRFHSSTVRNNTMQTEQNFLEYMSLAKFIRSEFGNNSDTIDHILYLYCSHRRKGMAISFAGRLKINFFLITTRPFLYLKTIIKSFNEH